MDIKTEIKEEDHFPEIASQTKGESSSQDSTLKLSNSNFVCDNGTENKAEIKKESVDSDTVPHTDWGFFCENPVIQVKRFYKDYKKETRTEISEKAIDAECCHEVMKSFHQDPEVNVKQCNKEYEDDSRLQIKEELCWMEGTSMDAAYTDDGTKDVMDDSFHSTVSARLHAAVVPRSNSALSFSKDSGDHSCNVRNDSSDSETTMRSKSKESEWVYPENYVAGKMDGTSSCLKHNSVQCNSTQEPNMPKNCCFNRCDVCEKKFTLKSHMKKQKLIPVVKRIYNCNICGKDFTLLSNLNTHKLIHEGKSPYECIICGKNFIFLSQLKKHEMVHDGIRQYICDICGRDFIHLWNLKEHKLSHEGKKPHHCNTCGKSFTLLSSLKQHWIVHDGNKSHACDTCGKSFARSSNLKEHQKVHSDKRP